MPGQAQNTCDHILRFGGMLRGGIDQDAACFIEPGDGVALAGAMETLLGDEALRRRMGAAGRAVVEKDFSASVCVPRILSEMKAAVRR